MAFPIVTPSYLKELVDLDGPEYLYDSFTEILLSPASVEYVLHINSPIVVRKLMSITDAITYKMSYAPEKEEEEFQKRSEELMKINPTTAYYWKLRELMMGVLQNKEVTFEKRMLLLNYGLKNVQGMIDQGQPELIPQFISDYISGEVDYGEVLQYFSSISPNFPFALTDGISLLKSITKTTPAYKEVINKVYRNLGVSGPETLQLINMEKYLDMRKAFSTEFMEEHSNWIENIMVNFVWAYSIPFACPDKLNIWDNYVFFNSLYNALKILITCYMPKSDDDFVKAITALGDALLRTGKDIVWKIVVTTKNAGQANNGDMAVLTIS